MLMHVEKTQNRFRRFHVGVVLLSCFFERALKNITKNSFIPSFQLQKLTTVFEFHIISFALCLFFWSPVDLITLK